MTVIDASAVVDLLAPPNRARQAALVREFPDPRTPWLAPDVLPFEVFAAFRRRSLKGLIAEPAARLALERLAQMPLELVPTMGLLPSAWVLRDGFGAADALYAALALRAGEPLLTTDTRLANAAGAAGVTVRAR
jgi:predicted nucleic acid-binding protein